MMPDMFIDFDGSVSVEDLEQSLKDMVKNPHYKGRRLSFGFIGWPETKEKMDAMLELFNKYGKEIEEGKYKPDKVIQIKKGLSEREIFNEIKKFREKHPEYKNKEVLFMQGECVVSRYEDIKFVEKAEREREEREREIIEQLEKEGILGENTTEIKPYIPLEEILKGD